MGRTIPKVWGVHNLYIYLCSIAGVWIRRVPEKAGGKRAGRTEEGEAASVFYRTASDVERDENFKVVF